MSTKRLTTEEKNLRKREAGIRGNYYNKLSNFDILSKASLGLEEQEEFVSESCDRSVYNLGEGSRIISKLERCE